LSKIVIECIRWDSDWCLRWDMAHLGHFASEDETPNKFILGSL